MKAYVYCRWSSLEQGKRRDGEDGDANTLTRQIGNATRYCERMGWDVVEIITDEGRSAYTGENLTTGNLAEFTRRLENQLIPQGSVLVVEKLDRISRLPPDEAYDWIRKVFRLGISIAVANDNRVYDRNALNSDPWAFMGIINEAFRSHGESKRKSELLSDSWALRRKEAASGKIGKTTTVGPAWLEWNREERLWIFKDEGKGPLLDRVAIVRRIFDMAEKGIGRRMIAKKLNDENVPCWGRGESKANGWHDSYVTKILANRSVLGERQDHTKPKGSKHRVPVGEPNPNAFPRVIDADQFARIQAQAKRVVNTGSSAKGAYNFLFSGLAYCQQCGGKMRFNLKARTEGQDDESYLVCDNATRRVRGDDGNAKCVHTRGWRYPWFERSVLDSLLHLVLDDSYFATPGDIGRIQTQVAQLERDLEIKRSRQKRFLTLYGDGDDDAKEAYEQARDEAKAGEATLDRLQGELVDAKGRVSPAEHLRRVSNVRSAMTDYSKEVRYEARARVSSALHQVVSFVRFDQETRQAWVVLLGGAHALLLDDQGNVQNEGGVLASVNEPTVDIPRERDYAAEQLRRDADREEFDHKGKFNPVWKEGQAAVDSAAQLRTSLAGGNSYRSMLLDEMTLRSKKAGSNAI